MLQTGQDLEVQMTDKIRVGIVGATLTQGGSGWGANAHVPALKALPNYELKAICTSHEDTAKASKEMFNIELAFHDIKDMVAHPDIDLIAVVVRVPDHAALVEAAANAGKDVFCEWPLAANLLEAQRLNDLAHQKGVRTLVGLQGRSDPTLLYARELIQQGYIGEIVTAKITWFGGNPVEHGPGTIWQGRRSAGANTMTIVGGHSMDTLCFLAGEFASVSTRLQTIVSEWRNSETGESFAVDSPDNVIVAGDLVNGASVSVHIASVPVNSNGGSKLEIYGRQGALVITAPDLLNMGPNTLFGGRAGETMAEMAVPERFRLVPEGTPSGLALNVAQAYTRFAQAHARGGGGGFDPD